MKENIEMHKNWAEIHRKSIIVDMHCDAIGAFVPFELRPNTLEWHMLFPVERTLGDRSNSGQVDLPRLIEGGIDCVSFTSGANGPCSSYKALQNLEVIYSEIDKNYDKVSIVTTYDEIIKNKSGGKVSAILSFEGAEPIENDLRILRIMYRLGIRIITLVWIYRNLLADPCTAKRLKSGLSDFGVSAVEEMNRIGIIVDVSHLNDVGFWDVLEVSKDPVIASHACCRGLSHHPRNLTDEMIKALSEKGGVIGITFVKRFLSEDAEKATIDSVVNHIDHAIDVGGIDHVGIGSDFDGGGLALQDATKMPEITKRLVNRGYSDNEVQKILGGNFLRVIKKVWKT
jgi:membrane dipeptidase